MALAPNLTITTEMQARVRAVAERHGLSPDAALSGLLETILRAEENALPGTEQERIALADTLARSSDDIAAGHWVALEDLQARREARHGR